MTTPPPNDVRHATTRADADDADGDERVRPSRAFAWIVVGLVVVLGIVLYFAYARRLSPLLG